MNSIFSNVKNVNITIAKHLILHPSSINFIIEPLYNIIAGVAEWTKAPDLGSGPVGVRGFESHPPHYEMLNVWKRR